jgi:hypothetical protein
VTDKGALKLKDLRNLESLSFSSTKVTEEAVTELRNALPRARSISR